MVRLFLLAARLMGLMAGVNATPESATQRWQQGLGAAGEKVRQGVAAVTRAPGEAAAASADKYLAGVQQGVDKFKARVRGVSLGDWQASMSGPGVQNMATAASQKAHKYNAAIADLLPHIAEGARKVQGMPKNTLQDSIGRMVAFTQHMAGYRRRG